MPTASHSDSGPTGPVQGRDARSARARHRGRGQNGDQCRQGKSGAVGRIVWRLLAVICLVAITACAATYENHGYVPTDEELALPQGRQGHPESVENMVGQPWPWRGLLNDVGWFYVQTRWKKYGIRPMQEIGREVLVISLAIRN